MEKTFEEIQARLKEKFALENKELADEVVPVLQDTLSSLPKDLFGNYPVVSITTSFDDEKAELPSVVLAIHGTKKVSGGWFWAAADAVCETGKCQVTRTTLKNGSPGYRVNLETMGYQKQTFCLPEGDYHFRTIEAEATPERLKEAVILHVAKAYDPQKFGGPR
jgi:hypothetical protein